MTRSRYRPLASVLIVGLTACTVGGAGLLKAQGPAATLKSLPACAHLPAWSPGPEPVATLPYMATMRALGIQRAAVEVRGVWQDGRLASPFVARRLYYRCDACLSAQITDLATLARLRRSLLQPQIDRTALGFARVAGPSRYFERVPRLNGRRVHFWVFLPSRPSMGQSPTGLSRPLNVLPLKRPSTQLELALAAVRDDDALALSCVLAGGKLGSSDLTTLLEAAAGPGPRADAIELLGAAGADANAPVAAGDRRGDLPLADAIGSPTNVAALLDIGASPTAADSEGQTPIEHARRASALNGTPQLGCSLALLEAASARNSHYRDMGELAIEHPRAQLGRAQPLRQRLHLPARQPGADRQR